MSRRWTTLRSWEPRRWLVAAIGTVVVGLLVALPTAVIPNPIFGRAVSVTWWSYPTVLVSAVLGGLLIATYVRSGPEVQKPKDESVDRPTKLGMAGGFIAFFAVGCPVCNKLVLLALGATGAITWFAPIQPLLALASIGLMGYALAKRLDGEVACAVPAGLTR